MASKRTLALLLRLHSWFGLVVGLLLFVVCLSGALLVFKHEIDLWANPSLAALPHARSPVGAGTVFDAVQAALPDLRVRRIEAPDVVRPVYFVFAEDAHGRMSKLAARADTGALIGPVDSQLGQFIRMVHVFLLYGPRWIVGFLGVAMLVLTVTGIVLHRKMLQEVFTLRWDRSFRLIVSDAHKAIGTWALLFQILIAFTGAWLGLAPLFERSVAVFADAPPRAVKPAMDGGKAMAGKGGARISGRDIDQLVARSRGDIAGFQPLIVTVQYQRAKPATVTLQGELDGHLASTARIRYALADRSVPERFDPRERGFWSQFNALMEPLHFGDFGGLVLKTLYFLLGLTPAFLSLSGTLIWLDRKRLERWQAGAKAGSHA